MEIITMRHGLKDLDTRVGSGGLKELTIGFLGGSLTEQKVWRNWPEPVLAWISEHYPDTRLIVENAAIGATGVQSAVFRVDHDILRHGCDVLFVEYAVNDYFTDSIQRKRAMEGLVRKCYGHMEIVFVYLFNQPMLASMLQGQVPQSIQDFEQIAEQYGLDSVWAGMHALKQVQKGRIRWEEWLPDGLHPHHRGSQMYADAIIEYMEHACTSVPSWKNHQLALPVPISEDHWGDSYLLDWSDVETKGPWKLRRATESAFIDRFLETSAPGASLSFNFTGKGLSLGFQFGSQACEYRYRIDGCEWIATQRERPQWAGEMGWHRVETLYDDLPCGNHQFELETFHGDREECKGTRCHLTMIGVRP